MLEIEELREKYRKFVPEELYKHNIRVQETAGKLADRFGVDEYKAAVAGLVHDIGLPRADDLLSMARKYQIEVLPLEKAAPILLHGPVGAKLLPELLGIDDGEIIGAVYWHTTGRAGASDLVKIVFLADKMDQMEGKVVEEVNSGLGQSLDRGVLACVDNLIPDQINRGFALHPQLVEMRNEIVLGREGQA